MFGRADGAVRLAFILSWLAALGLFWTWWFEPEHLVTPAGLALNSALLAYLSYLPIYFVLTTLRLRRVNPALPVDGWRVAFVVTKAPSEPWEVVHRTLRSMLAQDFPHPYDVWICDEDPADETYEWCRRHGVGISTRRGFPEYHRAEWPRRTKCKEGNLAFFYDHWGYDYYDVVAQLDADHVPAPGYLAHMVRPFADPKIGYVAAPSVCDANADRSWAARGRLYREANLHGPVQVGSNGWLAPVCFGSHYAVRTTALRDIGGIGPELAEDFSTTYLMCSSGWQGAFALDAEAHGDGPDTLAAALTQEFQWSRSLMTLFTGLYWRHARRLSFLQRLRFLFSLSYYPLLAVTTAAGLLLAPIACFTGLRWVAVSYLHFLLMWGFTSAILLALNAYLRRRQLFRPVRAKLTGWENWLFAMVRWPYVGWGCIAGVLARVRRKPVNFKVTPKGDRGVERLPVRLLAPFAAVCVIAFTGTLHGAAAGGPPGYMLLSLGAGLAYLVVIVAICALHVVETRRATGAGAEALAGTVSTPLLLAGVLAVLGAVATAATAAAFADAHVNLLDLFTGHSR